VPHRHCRQAKETTV